MFHGSRLIIGLKWNGRMKIKKIQNNAQKRTISAKDTKDLTAKSLDFRSYVLCRKCLSVKIMPLT